MGPTMRHASSEPSSDVEVPLTQHRCACGGLVPCVVECRCATCLIFGPIPASPWCVQHRRHATPLDRAVTRRTLRGFDPARVPRWVCAGEGKGEYHDVPVPADEGAFSPVVASGEAAVWPEDYALFQLAEAPFWQFADGFKRTECRNVKTPQAEKRWGPKNVYAGREAVVAWGYGPMRKDGPRRVAGTYYALRARILRVERVARFADASEDTRKWAALDLSKPSPWYDPEKPSVLTRFEDRLVPLWVENSGAPKST